MSRVPPRSCRTDTLFPYTTLFRSAAGFFAHGDQAVCALLFLALGDRVAGRDPHPDPRGFAQHRRVGELHRRTRDLVAGDLARARLETGGPPRGDRDGLGGGRVATAAIVA